MFNDLRLYIALLSLVPLLCAFILLITERHNGIKGPLGAIWVTINTITTLGYGETFPLTAAGSIVMILALSVAYFLFLVPIPLIGARFLHYKDIFEERFLLAEAETTHIRHTMRGGRENGRVSR